jgi:hypothetical protein
VSPSTARRATLSAWLAVFLGPVPATAQQPAVNAIAVDRSVVRFSAPEIGGGTQPRFIGERTLAFEARLEAMSEGAGAGDEYDDRQVRAALDRHVSQEVLAALAHTLIAGSPPGQRPSETELERLQQELGSALLERLGGRESVEAAAKAEQLDVFEVEALFRRQALAAWYIDRAVTPILHPDDDQLREVFRTSAHPYRGKPFESVRVALGRWFVIERLRVAESAYLQETRSRVRITVLP